MEVKFENGKTIIDGTPALLYLNEKGHGVGQIYRNGERLTGLIKVNIEAETDRFTTFDVKLNVTRNKPETVIIHTDEQTFEIEVDNND